MTFYKFIMYIAKFLVWILFSCKVEGKENLPKDGGYVLCCNHRSYVDPVFLGINVKQELSFMAKAELFRKRILNWFFRKLNAFPVERGKGDTGALDHAVDVVRQGKILALFPEGTRSKDGHLLPLKSGVVVVASETKASIVPAAIKFDGKLGFRKKVLIRFGTPVPYESLQISLDDRRTLRQARNLIKDELLSLLGETEQ